LRVTGMRLVLQVQAWQGMAFAVTSVENTRRSSSPPLGAGLEQLLEERF